MHKATLVLVALIISLSAHSGRTDANGGHYNRKTGGYHYHNGGTKSSTSTYSSASSTISRKTSSYFVQSALKLTGYYSGSIDGQWGSGTTTALKRFQKAKGLPQTGEMDNATKKQLFAVLQYTTISK